MSPQTWWYVARAAGVVSWLMLTASVVWGIVLASGAFPSHRRPAWLLDLHRWLGALTLGFLGPPPGRAGGRQLRRTSGWRISPFRSHRTGSRQRWRPVSSPCGPLLSVQVSSWLRKRISKRPVARDPSVELPHVRPGQRPRRVRRNRRHPAALPVDDRGQRGGGGRACGVPDRAPGRTAGSVPTPPGPPPGCAPSGPATRRGHRRRASVAVGRAPQERGQGRGGREATMTGCDSLPSWRAPAIPSPPPRGVRRGRHGARRPSTCSVPRASRAPRRSMPGGGTWSHPDGATLRWCPPRPSPCRSTSRGSSGPSGPQPGAHRPRDSDSPGCAGRPWRRGSAGRWPWRRCRPPTPGACGTSCSTTWSGPASSPGSPSSTRRPWSATGPCTRASTPTPTRCSSTRGASAPAGPSTPRCCASWRSPGTCRCRSVPRPRSWRRRTRWGGTSTRRWNRTPYAGAGGSISVPPTATASPPSTCTSATATATATGSSGWSTSTR